MVSSLKFSRCIGIDYSGAQHAHARLPGLRVFEADSNHTQAHEVRPDSARRNIHWTRAEIANWLVEQIVRILEQANSPLLIGIDHALSFPLAYFDKYQIEKKWDIFLSDFCTHWGSLKSESTVREILCHKPKPGRVNPTRTGESRWRRIAEQKSRGAKSVFHFGVPGSVASSTHAGLVWIHFLRHHPRLRDAIHFWPFDGWIPANGKSVITEIYPAIWNKNEKKGLLTQDQHDARVVARALYQAERGGDLIRWFNPECWNAVKLSTKELEQAQVEGWILGLGIG